MNTSLRSRVTTYLMLAGLAACATPLERPGPESYSVQVTDNVSARRFDVVLRSHDARPLCVSIENWPSDAGRLHMGRDVASVHTADGVLFAHDDNFGYCPGGCGEHRIEPHGELRGFIAYEAFGDATRLSMDSSKRLQFSVAPSYCRR